jgi:hypothetical protein
MKPNRKLIEALATSLTKRLAADGKLVEGGWLAHSQFMIPPLASQDLVDAMHTAYMAGAQHLFASMMNIMDPGEEPTEADLRRLSLINDELEVWRKQMWAMHIDDPTGRA